MPKIDKLYTLEVTPEKFLNACSATELQELELLLYSPRYRDKLKGRADQPDKEKKSYLISKHPKYGEIKTITCLYCSKTSFNPGDVEQKYCGFCHRFHED